MNDTQQESNDLSSRQKSRMMMLTESQIRRLLRELANLEPTRKSQRTKQDLETERKRKKLYDKLENEAKKMG